MKRQLLSGLLCLALLCGALFLAGCKTKDPAVSDPAGSGLSGSDTELTGEETGESGVRTDTTLPEGPANSGNASSQTVPGTTGTTGPNQDKGTSRIEDGLDSVSLSQPTSWLKVRLG